MFLYLELLKFQDIFQDISFSRIFPGQTEFQDISRTFPGHGIFQDIFQDVGTLTCPNHLNLPCLTTSATLCTPRRLYKSTLRFLSFSDTPHIHLTLIRSILSRLSRFPFFIAQVSVPYVNALWTQALYIFPFMRYDAPRAVTIGNNSLNFA